jgi:hypothetical protein
MIRLAAAPVARAAHPALNRCHSRGTSRHIVFRYGEIKETYRPIRNARLILFMAADTLARNQKRA